MSDPVQITIISGVQAIVVLLIGAWLKNGQNVNHTDLSDKVDTLTKNTDGIVSKLEAATQGRGLAEGELTGRAAARVEAKEDKKEV